MKEKTETLVIITPGFPADETDSTCLPLQQALLKSMQQQNPILQIRIFTLHYPYRSGAYTWNGIPVTAFNGKRKGGLFRYLLWAKLNKALVKLSQSQNIKGIISFWCGESALFAKWFTSKKNIPHFCWILGQDAKADNRFVKKIKPAPGELVALSDFIRETFLHNHGINPALVIQPGIDCSMYGTPPSQKKTDILAAGSLIKLKQYELFAEIVSEIRKKIPVLKVVLAGQGPEKKNIEKLIREKGLNETITLKDEIPYKELLEEMQQARLFLHTSSYEGFGMVCAEALYAGAHVISFCKPMSKEITHWHIVSTATEMTELAIKLLNTETDFTPVITRKIEDTASSFLQLFP